MRYYYDRTWDLRFISFIIKLFWVSLYLSLFVPLGSLPLYSFIQIFLSGTILTAMENTLPAQVTQLHIKKTFTFFLNSILLLVCVLIYSLHKVLFSLCKDSYKVSMYKVYRLTIFSTKLEPFNIKDTIQIKCYNFIFSFLFYLLNWCEQFNLAFYFLTIITTRQPY